MQAAARRQMKEKYTQGKGDKRWGGGAEREDEAGGDEDSSEKRDGRFLTPWFGAEPLFTLSVYFNLCVLPT